MNPLRFTHLAIAAILLAGCATSAGTGAPAAAKRFASVHLELDVHGAGARRVLDAPLDPIAEVTAAHVKTVRVTLADTAPDAPAPTVATIVDFDTTRSAVTFTNLQLGHFYKVTCQALGTDPNGVDPADPTADLTDPDPEASTAYVDVPALVDGTADQDLTGRLTDAARLPLSVQKLPLKLYTPIFRGHGQSNVEVTGGGIENTTDDVTAE